MFNIDPDNHIHATIPTDTKCYSDEQFVRDVKYLSDLSLIQFNARSLNKNFKKLRIQLTTSHHSYCRNLG